MTRRRFSVTISAVLLGIGFLSSGLESALGADAAKMQEMMKAWQQYATPGEGHKIFSDMTGKWKYTSKFWESENAKPFESGGSSVMKLILGGRYLQHEIKGSAMGMPFEGIGITGYDNIKGMYETIWLDNMGTGIMHGSGSFDEKTRTLTDSGSHSCPMSKDKTRKYRSEWKVTDKNRMVYTMYGPGPDGGKEFKQMEMVFKRNQ